MTIKDIERILGITEGTIDRLIKRPDGERLLQPKKNANGYYDYSPEEIQWLKRYKILSAILKLKYEDILALEREHTSLADMLHKQLVLSESKKDQVILTMELAQKLIDSNATYEDFPVNELFEQYCKPADNNQSIDYDFVDDTTPISLVREFFCPCCGKKIILDLADFINCDYSNEAPMGKEIVYEYSTEDTFCCPACKRVLCISGYTSEYPVGSFNYEKISLTARIAGI